MKITSKIEITKQDVKTILKTLGILIGQSLAWFFILPLDYTYAKQTFVVVQYLPIVSMGLIVLWIFRIVLKNNKQPNLRSDKQ